MANRIVLQLVDDDGVPVPEDEQCYHMVIQHAGGDALSCTGEYIAPGSSSNNGELYEEKTVKRGGVTCSRCLAIIEFYKNYRY